MEGMWHPPDRKPARFEYSPPQPSRLALLPSRKRYATSNEHVQDRISVGALRNRMMVIPARFERATPRLGIWCSILLSYGTTDDTHTKVKAVRQGIFGVADKFVGGARRAFAVSRSIGRFPPRSHSQSPV